MYSLSDSAELDGVNPIDVIFARSRTLLRGRGATGPVAAAKYSAVVTPVTRSGRGREENIRAQRPPRT